MSDSKQQFWSPLVRQLVPYVPGEQPKLTNLVKLNTNENPYPPSPAVLEAIRSVVDGSLRLYPDPDASALKEAIAGHYGIPAVRVFVGNGSDEVLAHVFMAFFKQDRPILFPDITYSFYKVYAALYEVEFRTVPLTPDFRIDVADYGIGNGGVILPNPNAPTGCLLSLDEISRLLIMHPSRVVVIDEAYIDFGGESAVSLIDRHPNLLVTQTVSKSRSLAGLRIGVAMGQEHLIEALERVKNSFNSYPMDRLAIAGGVAAFADRAYFEATCERIIRQREALSAALNHMGFQVLPSAANFLFVRHPARDAGALAAALRERSIIVRHFKQSRIDQFLRITVGAEQDNQALLAALGVILSA